MSEIHKKPSEAKADCWILRLRLSPEIIKEENKIKRRKGTVPRGTVPDISKKENKGGLSFRTVPRLEEKIKHLMV